MYTVAISARAHRRSRERQGVLEPRRYKYVDKDGTTMPSSYFTKAGPGKGKASYTGVVRKILIVEEETVE